MGAERVALITGISGQDGSYLAELLLEKGYRVHGTVRRIAFEDPERRLWRLKGIMDRVELHAASIDSFPSLYKLVARVRPDECYHLAASSFVSYSFEEEFETLTANLNGTHYLLSAVLENAPGCRFYFAGTSEMFGNARETPQREESAFVPRSIYGISKVAGFDLVRNYRERSRMHASSGILYNHESPRRGFEFVTQKIAHGAARAAAGGGGGELRLGNLDAVRDWGHARDYVRAMWMMLQREEPADFVIATGRSRSVREFVGAAFRRVGLDPAGHVVTDPQLFRESEAVPLCGDAGKAGRELGWVPEISFEDLVAEMVDAAVERVAGSGRLPA
jgi:GDPmannose 4,6-dehydratase